MLGARHRVTSVVMYSNVCDVIKVFVCPEDGSGPKIRKKEQFWQPILVKSIVGAAVWAIILQPLLAHPCKLLRDPPPLPPPTHVHWDASNINTSGVPDDWSKPN